MTRRAATSQQAALFEDIPTGARISEIAPLPSDPNLRRVRVEGRTVATLRAADVQALALEVNQPWTAKRADAVRTALAMSKARKVAIGLLGRRAYSRGEVLDRLARRGHDAAITQRLTDELERDGWLDDAAYAAAVAREVCRTRPAAASLVARKLETRGIAPELAQAAARAATAGQDGLSAALALARRRFATMGGLKPATATRRLAGLLARRGFDADTVGTVLHDLGLPNDEHRDEFETGN